MAPIAKIEDKAPDAASIIRLATNTKDAWVKQAIALSTRQRHRIVISNGQIVAWACVQPAIEPGRLNLDIVTDKTLQFDDRVELSMTLIDSVRNDFESQITLWSRNDTVTKAAASRLSCSLYRHVRRMNSYSPEQSAPSAEVRPFSDQDSIAICSIDKAAFGQHQERRFRTTADFWNDFHELGDCYEDLLIIGNPDGFCWIKPDGEIFVLAIHPNSQGKGYGARLLHSGIVRLRSHYKCSEIYLYVENDNHQAINFYLKNGFKFTDVDYKGWSVPMNDPTK